MIWRVFTTKRSDEPVQVVLVNREARIVYVEKMPTSQKALITALCEYWKENEMDWSITEVLRFEKPAHVFFAVQWLEGEDE
jgi:hypothetical protein